MKGIVIHGALLAVMLGVAYQTWTRDKTVRVSTGEVELWDRGTDDISAIEFQTTRKDATTGAINERTVRVERRDGYWWGLETRSDQKPKPAPVPDAGVPDAAPSGDAGVRDAGVAKATDAGAVADAGAAKPGDAAPGGDAAPAVTDAGAPAVDAAPPPVAELETKTTKTEFPIGNKFPVIGQPAANTWDDLLKGWASMHAVRALGTLTDQQKKDFGLDDSTATFTLVFKDGSKAFALGDKVSGSKERYAIAVETSQAYILSGTLIDPVEGGQGTLAPTSPSGFEMTDVARVTITAGDGKTKRVDRITAANDKGVQTKTWGDGITQKPDQTLANFVDGIDKLRPQSYEPDVKVADLTKVVALSYADGGGKVLGTFTVYKREKAADKPAAPLAAPTPTPATTTEWFIVTETTRVPAKVLTPVAERVEQDLPTVFAN